MNLRLDRPMRTTQFGGDKDRLIGAVSHTARGHANAKARQQRFGLVLMNVHKVSCYLKSGTAAMRFAAVPDFNLNFISARIFNLTEK
jgi:hypothetical protein